MLLTDASGMQKLAIGLTLQFGPIKPAAALLGTRTGVKALSTREIQDRSDPKRSCAIGTCSKNLLQIFSECDPTRHLAAGELEVA